MGIYDSVSLDRVQPTAVNARVAAAVRPDAVQKTAPADGAAATVKQNYDTVTISEEGRAAAEAQKRCDAWSRAFESRNEMIEGLNDVSFSTYSPSTGRLYINMSAFDRYWQTKRWEWQENLRVNDPEAYEAWFSEHEEMKEPRFSTSGEQDVYAVWDLTPDADGKTALDHIYEKHEELTRLAALIEAQYRESRKKEEEESGEPSAAERLETQNAKLEEAPQTNDLEAFEIRSDPEMC